MTQFILFGIGVLVLIVVSFFALKITFWTADIEFNGNTVAPLLVSGISLLVSSATLFKSKIFPPNVITVLEGYALTGDIGPNNEFPIIVPLQFLNDGYGDAIVERIGLKIVGSKDKKAKIYQSVTEIDFQKLIQASGKINATNILGQISAFPLPAQTSRKMAVHFQQRPDVPQYPPSPFQEGEYTIELYIKLAGWEKPKKVNQVLLRMTKHVLAMQKAGNGTISAETPMEIE